MSLMDPHSQLSCSQTTYSCLIPGCLVLWLHTPTSFLAVLFSDYKLPPHSQLSCSQTTNSRLIPSCLVLRLHKLPSHSQLFCSQTTQTPTSFPAVLFSDYILPPHSRLSCSLTTYSCPIPSCLVHRLQTSQLSCSQTIQTLASFPAISNHLHLSNYFVALCFTVWKNRQEWSMWRLITHR